MRALAILFVCMLPVTARAETIARATAHLNGVTSARGFFNITVRLYQLPGVEWAKYDLVRSMITLDFASGSGATESEVKALIAGAGYKSGPVRIETVEKPVRYDHRLGWNRIRRPTAGNAVGRWFQLNF
jgi:hypothetical protein